MWETPYLTLDLATVDRTLTATAAWAQQHGVGLRPHAKTHKSPHLARRQLDAGAVGLTVATVGEAEVMVAGIPGVPHSGATDVFIAYPLWLTPPKAHRLGVVMDQAQVSIGCDSVEALDELLRYRDALPCLPELMLEVDSGQHRSGADPSQVGKLAQQALSRGLVVRGAFTFPGHSYGPDARQAAAQQEGQALAEAAMQLHQVGVDAPVISGGSTPSLEFSNTEVLTEARPGVYITGDAQQLELGACALEDVALTVRSTVVSHRDGHVVVDAGSKALGADRAPWATGFGRVAENLDARIVALSEHHATIAWNAPHPPALGSQLAVIPNHACNAINLATEYCVAGGEEPMSWPVVARGRNA